MALIRIDESKCKKDGLCKSECPMGIIQLPDDGFPVMAPGGELMCNFCGHCVAVCPHGALDHEHVPLDASPAIDKRLVIDDAQAVQFLRSRRSVRFYKDQPVEKEKIQRLIETARYAPTGSNSQLVEWQVFSGKEKIRDIVAVAIDFMREMVKGMDGDDPYKGIMSMIVAGWEMGFNAMTWDAPALLLASAPKAARSGQEDVVLTLSYLDLMAPALGLGTCWAGLLQNGLKMHEPLRAAMHLPEAHKYHYPMMLGYPRHRYYRLPERKAPTIAWR